MNMLMCHWIKEQKQNRLSLDWLGRFMSFVMSHLIT